MATGSSPPDDLLTARIRHKLQQDQIKLWLPPYIDSSTGISVSSSLEELALNCSDVVAVAPPAVLAALEKLQAHALEKLAARSRYQSTGVATLRFKVVGRSEASRSGSVGLALTETGAGLRRAVRRQLGDGAAVAFKMICNGAVLRDEAALDEQRVANNALVLVVLSATDPEAQRLEAEMRRQVETVRADAELLADAEDGGGVQDDDDDSAYLRIADQSGNAVRLPPHEKKSLVVAMALHEKGRSALKRRQVALALTLLHEADGEFRRCGSRLLDAVDNAGRLDLDIAWCYLLLGGVDDVPDAAVRLERCQRSLAASYGPNLERLVSLKGTTGNEAVLYLRLHLLQGVVAFHQGRTAEAGRLLHQAQEELTRLVVRDDQLSQLVSLGYTVRESRRGLRAAAGDVNEACVLMERRRHQRRQRQLERRQDEERRRQRRRLGRTAAGRWVNLGYWRSLVDMGFDEERAARALRRTDNDLGRSVDALNAAAGQTDADDDDDDDADVLARVVSLGFPVRLARDVLRKHGGDLEKAVDELTATAACQDLTDHDEEKVEDAPSTSSNGGGGQRRMEREEREAYRRLAQDLPDSDDDDPIDDDDDLQLEAAYLRQYLERLAA